jgi:hypothetical protein
LTTQVEQPLKTLERINTYAEFVRDEGIPLIRGFAIQDLKTAAVEPWPRKGALTRSVISSKR